MPQMLPIEEYQVATEHTWESVRRRAGELDWSNQPDPFRRWEGAPLTLLPLPAPQPGALCQEVLGQWYGVPAAADPGFTLDSLSSLLFHSVAISAWKIVPGTAHRWSLRVPPSSGNLHPTETWVVARGVGGLPDGIHHYRVDLHALEATHDGEWVTELLAAAGRGSRDIHVVVALTSAFWREAWKYRKRALRYCHLDAGHAAASILGAARALGWSGGLIGHFADDVVAAILDCRRGGEEPLLLIPLAGGQALPGLGTNGGAVRGLRPSPARGDPSRFSPREEVDADIVAAFASTKLEACAVRPRPTAARDRICGSSQVVSLPPPRQAALPYAVAARRRRSAVDHDWRVELPAASLSAALRAALPQPPRDWAGWEVADETAGRRLVAPLVLVSRVAGVVPGAYRVLADGTLQAIMGGNFSQAAGYLSLEQEMAAHAAALFTLVGDLPRGFAAHGGRGWRYAHFEAGFFGQGLYLAAAAGGFSATGIGAFYDAEVHRFWQIEPERDGRVLYHFALGGAPVQESGLVMETRVEELYPTRARSLAGVT